MSNALSTVQALAEKHPGETLLLVTHGGDLQRPPPAGDGPQDWRFLWDPRDRAISVLQWTARNGMPFINDISHLPPDAVVTQATDSRCNAALAFRGKADGVRLVGCANTQAKQDVGRAGHDHLLGGKRGQRAEGGPGADIVETDIRHHPGDVE